MIMDRTYNIIFMDDITKIIQDRIFILSHIRHPQGVIVV